MGKDHLDTNDLLAQSTVFKGMSAHQHAALIKELIPMSTPGGNLLFAEGEAADDLYILKSGSVGLFRVSPKHRSELLMMVKSGEIVGAFDMLTNQPHRLEARAIRDSELLRLPRTGFEWLIKKHPEAILHSAQMAVERAAIQQGNHQRIRPRTFALLPFTAQVDTRRVAERLKMALSVHGECVLIDQSLGRDKDSSWFAEREHKAHFVVYVDEGRDNGWRELCRRQADALLLVASADSTEAVWPDSDSFNLHSVLERPRYFLLHHPGNDIVRGAARRWLKTFSHHVQLHHVREGRLSDDFARLARILTHNSFGLVLSGGGAHGFAAIGAVKALREAGIMIDAVGGTSIGAIIGAGVALEWDNERMVETCRHAFVDGKPLRDRTLPIVSLSRGRRTVKLLREAFGEVDIEDMPLPYYCVTSNLSSGFAETRHHGRLWFWLRASCAIPGVLPPVLHHRQVYVDGAVTNNLPVDVMCQQGIGHIIACDIGTDTPLNARVEEAFLPGAWKVLAQSLYGSRPSMLPLLIRTGLVNADVASVHQRELADTLLCPPIKGVKLLEWKAFDEVVNKGYAYTKDILVKHRIRI